MSHSYLVNYSPVRRISIQTAGFLSLLFFSLFRLILFAGTRWVNVFVKVVYSAFLILPYDIIIFFSSTKNVSEIHIFSFSHKSQVIQDIIDEKNTWDWFVLIKLVCCVWHWTFLFFGFKIAWHFFLCQAKSEKELCIIQI